MKPFYEDLDGDLWLRRSGADRFPEHLHPQAELFYLFSGEATLTVDGRECPLGPGDLCLCFPGVIHGYLEPRGADGLMMIFTPERLTDFTASFTHTLPENPVLPRACLKGDVAACMECLRAECEGDTDLRAVWGYLQVVLSRVMPLLSRRQERPEVSDVAYRIIKYLSGHYSEPLDVPKLSRALGVSPSHVSHTLSRRLHTDFRGCLNMMRLDRACELLQSGEDSVTRIAYECGFESVRTFNRAFRRQYDQTPTRWRSTARRFAAGNENSPRAGQRRESI